MGPKGFREIGETIILRARYGMDCLSQLDGVKVLFGSNAFKEFVVNFDGIGKSVKAINQALLHEKIFGGIDLSDDFPELGNSALYCITEVHRKEDIDRLTEALEEIVAK